MSIIFAIFGIVLGQILYTDGQVVGSVNTVSTWNGGGQYSLVFKNNDASKTVCYVRFSLSLPSGTTIASKWNFDAVSGQTGQYTLASYVQIAPGAQSQDAGLNVNGNGKPTVSVLETKYLVNGVCGGSTSGGGGSGSGTTTTTTTNMPSTSNTCMGCLSNTNTDGPINSNLNKPFTDSIFTFYGAGGRGACGLDSGVPTISAAASGQLFKPDGQWKDACRADGQYMLDDPICKGICVKIDYNGKSLTVPINNKCPECAPNHVDLSIAAFNYLEPRGGEVGIAKGATLTYIKCPSTIKQC